MVQYGTNDRQMAHAGNISCHRKSGDGPCSECAPPDLFRIPLFPLSVILSNAMRISAIQVRPCVDER